MIHVENFFQNNLPVAGCPIKYLQPVAKHILRNCFNVKNQWKFLTKSLAFANQLMLYLILGNFGTFPNVSRILFWASSIITEAISNCHGLHTLIQKLILKPFCNQIFAVFKAQITTKYWFFFVFANNTSCCIVCVCCEWQAFCCELFFLYCNMLLFLLKSHRQSEMKERFCDFAFFTLTFITCMFLWQQRKLRMHRFCFLL